MTLENRTSTLHKFFFAPFVSVRFFFFSWNLFYQLYSCQTLRLTLCLCVPNSKSCLLAERREHLAGKDSSPWSPDLSGSSRISVWPRIPNMYTETEHTRGRLESRRGEKKKKKLLTVTTSLTINHPGLSPSPNENYISLFNMFMCDMQ